MGWWRLLRRRNRLPRFSNLLHFFHGLEDANLNAVDAIAPHEKLDDLLAAQPSCAFHNASYYVATKRL